MGRAEGPRNLVLDTGALIAIERGNDYASRLVQRADEVRIPAGALAQAWRDPSRQARLARLVGADDTIVHALDEDRAKATGRLCAKAGTTDVVDASVVILARELGGVPILTSDPDDLRRLAPDLPIVAI